jgi:uncharacterized protein (TIRG00374 family)
VRLALGAVVSGTCLFLATRGTDWGRVRDLLAGAHPLWVAAGVLAAVATLVIRAQRWVRLLAPVGDAPLAVAVSSTAIGFASGVVLPLRLGELVRPALLGRRTGIGLGPALASVLVERLLDVLFVVLSFLVLSAVAPLAGAVRAGARGLAIAAVLGFVVLVLAQHHRRAAERWLARVLPERARSLQRPVQRLIGGLLDGCAALGDGRTLARVCALSALLWAVTALVYVCAIRALAVPAPAIPAALASMVIVAAFVFLPQAPGLVGTWQAGCIVALGLFDVPHDLAVGYSFLTWLTAIVVQVGLGGFFLTREDLSWRDLLARSGSSPRP